ncbi:MAG: glycosyltransferase family 9 protein [Fimbriimonas sp.]
MKRYQGEALSPEIRIAVMANDALGNYVVSTPLLSMLRARYPQAVLHLYSGTRTQEFWSRDRRLADGHALFGSSPRETVAAIERLGGAQGYDLVVNMEWTPWAKAATALASGPETWVVGPALGNEGRGDLPFADDARGALWADQEWISPDLPQRFPFLATGFIGEIFCRLAYLEGEIPRYELPKEPVAASVPDVLIATSASLPEKLWPTEKWVATMERLRKAGRTVGLLGAKPAAQSKFWKGNDTEATLVESGLVEDLRGQFSLPQVVGALDAARQVLTLDNGILHLAAATVTPTVGLFRHGIHRLWAPPVSNIKVLTPGEERMVAEIEVETVLEALGIG